MKDLLYTFLSEIDNLQMFSLCKDFDELSLEDDRGCSQSSSTSCLSSSSTSCVPPSSYGYRSIIDRFLRSSTHSHSLWSKSISEQLRAPFIEFPRNSSMSYDLLMGIGFRFLPGQTNFIQHDFNLPKSFDRLTLISNSLGLSYNSIPLSVQELFNYSSGLRGLVNENSSKVLVEVITFYEGMYGRFLVLVCFH